MRRNRRHTNLRKNRNSGMLKSYGKISRKPGKSWRKRKVKWKKISIGILSLLFALSGIAIGYFFTHAKLNLTMEAGTKLLAEDFWGGPFGSVTFAKDSPEIDSSVPGEYKAKLRVNFISFESVVKIKDTIAPKATPAEVKLEYGTSCEITDFVIDVEDATEVTPSYIKEPDFMQTGRQEVVIRLEDLGGNKTEVASVLFIPNVKSLMAVEVGSTMIAADAFLIQEGTAEYITDVEQFNLRETGDLILQILVDGEPYDVTLRVQDTIPPEAVTVPVTGWVGKTIQPEAFIKEITNGKQVSVSYKTPPNFGLAGEQPVILCITDESGNVTEATEKMTLQKDKQPPVIQGEEITVIVGDGIAYKKHITAADDCDSPEEIKLDIDSAGVNLNRIGNYVVSCTATDTSGNKSNKNVTVIVTAKPEANVDAETVNTMADDILSMITYEGMTQHDKAFAIYSWVTEALEYITQSEKMSWIEGAYQGFTSRQGDCFVFAATARILLKRAGIENMDITKSTSKPNSHYWSLVNLGEGWYHFDTTPRNDNDNFFLATDAQIMAYSNSHGGTHTFDRSLYPPIN